MHHVITGRLYGGNRAVQVLPGVLEVRELGDKCMKKILDATCGSRTMWFNKEHPAPDTDTPGGAWKSFWNRIKEDKR